MYICIKSITFRGRIRNVVVQQLQKKRLVDTTCKAFFIMAQKVSNEVIIESYSRLKSVWLVGKEVGLCGQSVHERCVKLGIIESNFFSESEIAFIKENYKHYADNYILEDMAKIMGREKCNICRYARKLGLTNQKRILINSKCRKKLYVIYMTLCARCNNPNSSSYPNYGGRGIQNKFKSLDHFIEVMGDTYIKGLSIDRIDVNGHYEPSNVRWATWTQQHRNRRNNKYVEFNGKNILLLEYCEKNKLKFDTINNRISRLKWSVERALTTPIITPTNRKHGKIHLGH